MEKTPLSQEGIRLNVFLQEHGIASRRKADELIAAGLVTINGHVETKLGTRVQKSDEITVDGKKLNRKPSKTIYLFHKPYLTITSRMDDRKRPTIFDLPALHKLPKNVQPVGRLDFKSEGLLILTNDGDLAFALSHPKYSVEKIYAVLLSTPMTLEEMEKLKSGVTLEDGPAKPLFVRTGSKEKFGNSTGQWLEIGVTEGRNRLVRRMLETFGLKVVRLVRVAVGDIRLPTNLASGKIRPVTEAEKKYLLDLKKSMDEPSKPKKKYKNKQLSQENIEKIKEAKKKRQSIKKENYSVAMTKRQKDLSTLAKERKEKNSKIVSSIQPKKAQKTK